MLQRVGTGDQLTPQAAMAWRAVGGCTSPYSGYSHDKESLELGLVSPEIMTAMHVLSDWRSDSSREP
jgi:hypothetical protein